MRQVQPPVFQRDLLREDSTSAGLDNFKHNALSSRFLSSQDSNLGEAIAQYRNNGGDENGPAAFGRLPAPCSSVLVGKKSQPIADLTRALTSPPLKKRSGNPTRVATPIRRAMEEQLPPSPPPGKEETPAEPDSPVCLLRSPKRENPLPKLKSITCTPNNASRRGSARLSLGPGAISSPATKKLKDSNNNNSNASGGNSSPRKIVDRLLGRFPAEEVDTPAISASGDPSARRMARALLEMVESEARYQRRAEMIVAMRDLLKKKGLIDGQEFRDLFGNIQAIANLSNQFCGRLQEATSAVYDIVKTPEGSSFALKENFDINAVMISKVFFNMFPWFELYKVYVMNYDVSQRVLAQLGERKKAVALLNKHYPPQGFVDLRSALAEPMQRITRYALLINNLLEYAPESHPDRANLQRLGTEFTAFLVTVNDAKRLNEQTRGYATLYEMLPSGFRVKMDALFCSKVDPNNTQLKVGQLSYYGAFVSKPLTVAVGVSDSAEILERRYQGIKVWDQKPHESVVLTPMMFSPSAHHMVGPHNAKKLGNKASIEEEIHLFLCDDGVIVAMPAREGARFLKADLYGYETVWLVRDEHFPNDLLLVAPGLQLRLTVDSANARFREQLPPINGVSLDQWVVQIEKAVTQTLSEQSKKSRRSHCILSLDEFGFVKCSVPSDASDSGKSEGGGGGNAKKRGIKTEFPLMSAKKSKDEKWL